MAPLPQLLSVLVLAVAAIRGAPSPSGRTQKAPASIPAAWKALGDAPGSEAITFTLVFEPRDNAGLTARMEQIALTRSAWLTEEEVASYVAPTAEAKAAVDAAIKGIGATGVYSRQGDHVAVTTTVEKAAQFFGASFIHYQHTETSETAYKTHSYTIPASIANHISDVYPIATFGLVRSTTRFTKLSAEQEKAVEARATPAGCSTSAVTLACIRALYGFSSYVPTAITSTIPRIGIMAYIGQSFSPTDLKTYLTKFRSEAAAYTIPVVTSSGATNTPSSPGVESMLDTETVAGIIYPLPSTFYDVGTSNTAGDLFLISFQQFLALAVASRPTVITVSYGSDETDFTLAQATTMCNAAQQLSASGMTIVFSSGDSGVDGNGGETCPKFKVTYPGGCPYILSVGATQSFSPEVMVSTSLAGFYSGAGFSNYFPIPSYQATVVAAYIAGAGKTYIADYNSSGRAFPDISAQGSLQEIVYEGSTGLVGGTSCSAPIVAGGLTLLNNLLIAAGKATVGWAQPTFYANPSAFTDVTSGGSYDCGSTAAGLAASTGWDASAGLGTPQLAALRTVYGV